MSDNNLETPKRIEAPVTISTLERLLLMSAAAIDVDFENVDVGSDNSDLLFATEDSGSIDGKDGNDLVIGASGGNMFSDQVLLVFGLPVA